MNKPVTAIPRGRPVALPVLATRCDSPRALSNLIDTGPEVG